MVSGAVLLDKPPGITSFGALGPLKRAFETRKVGHTGTLDPFASGLLIALVGKMTRLADYITGQDKEYQAVFRFGEETDTLDPEGAVIKSADVPGEEAVRDAVARFTGSIEQRPPAYSAVHVGGVRAHRLARSGAAVEVPPRTVQVHALEILSWAPPELRVRIACGKGTYVRSLARDLGAASGSCAYVTELRRTRIGPYHVDEAVDPSAAGGGEGLLTPREFLALGGRIPEVAVEERYTAGVRNGIPLRREMMKDSPPREGIFVLVDAEKAVALCQSRDGELSYLAVL